MGFQFKIVNPKPVIETTKQKANRAFSVAVKLYALDLEQMVIDKIAEVDAVDTGKLGKSIRSKIKKEAGKHIIEILSTQKYAVFVNSGINRGFKSALKKGFLGAKFPNISKIRSWVKRNLQYTNLNTTTFLVARKIATKGIKAKPFYRLAYNQAKREAAGKIERYVKQILSENK